MSDFSKSLSGMITLLHEFTHVLQYQQLGFAKFGAKYASDLKSVGFDRHAVYDYKSRSTTYLTETLEGQAQIVGDYAWHVAKGAPVKSPSMQSLEVRLRGSGIYGF